MSFTDLNAYLAPVTSEVDRLAGRISALHPEDILIYTLRHETTTCNCGRIMHASRMWLTHKEGRGKNSRPMGKSENLYAKIPIVTISVTQGTPHCDLCVTSAKRESWLPRSGATSEGNFTPAMVAKSSTTRPTKPPEQNLDDLLGSIKL